ncbi:MAG: hypothetical protein JWN04_5029 [Myxococcaceae bacterium]|nr:hypothetical protein [Myxococcaceae bacterium]
MPCIVVAVVVWVFGMGQRRSHVEHRVRSAAELGGYQQSDEPEQKEQERRGP